MNTGDFVRRVVFMMFIQFALVTSAFASEVQQGALKSARELFETVFSEFGLADETVFDGIQKLSVSLPIAVSVESEIPKGQRRKYHASVRNKSLKEILNWLCELDGNYAWERDGNMVNLFPRSAIGDESYVFNRRISRMEFKRSMNVMSAFEVARDAFSAKDLAILHFVGAPEFGLPLTVTMEDVTLRQVLNRLARQLGPQHGWQYGSGGDLRFVMFHAGLRSSRGRNAGK